MSHKEKLLELYNNSRLLPSHSEVDAETARCIRLIAENCFTQKGVFTVFITLVIHKILRPEQDIRLHQSSMPGGFSGRTVDTKYITPTLKEIGFPSMAESGWLSRSLEQPHPYNLNYNGKIQNVEVKNAFLNLLDIVETKGGCPKKIILNLFHLIHKKVAENKVEITPLANPEKLNINDTIDILEQHFSFNYETHGGSKLSVIAFYAIFQNIITEMERYHGCRLGNLGSHTASDLTSRTAGDIEVYNSENKLIEAIEIKHDKVIDSNVLRVATEKIHKFNPRRYYIFSFHGIKEDDCDEINSIIKEVGDEHGCQIIVNGILPTIKYYLRLISSIPDFIENYRILVESDTELKKIHKDKLIAIFTSFDL